MFGSVRFAREGVEQQAPSRRKIDIVIPGVRAPVCAGHARKLHRNCCGRFSFGGCELGKGLTENENPDSMEHMKTKTIGLTLAFCFLGGAACFAADPQMGTWKLNEAKSKITPGTARFTTVTFKDMLGNIKVTGDGTDAKGKPSHVEWSGKFDGKNYPVTGDPTSDARSLKKIDDRTLELTVWNHGRAMVTGRIVVSADGKSRTVTTRGTDAKGKKFANTAVYDKQ